MKKIQFSSAVWKEGRYYVAQCLNVDVSSFGRTRSIAIKNLKEALTLYLEDSPGQKIRHIGKLYLNTQEIAYAP